MSLLLALQVAGPSPIFQPAWATQCNDIILGNTMKKNVAGQTIGAQLISKTDGSPVTTGTTTIYVTGDAGTQAVGSVGAGVCTHEGNGYWSYAPAQAETNYDLIAFTFVNTAACNASIQAETSFPQTGDSFAIVTAGGTGDNAAIKAKTDLIPAAPASTTNITAASGIALAVNQHVIVDSGTITTYTGNTPQTGDSFARIGVAGAGLTALGDTRLANLDAAVSTRLATSGYTAPDNATIAAIASYVDTEVAAIKAKTDQLVFTVANKVDANALLGGGGLDAAGVRAAIGLATANLDTQLANLVIVAKILRNKVITDPATGILTVYDDDNTTVYLSAQLYKDAAGTITYAGTGAERRQRMV